MEYVRVDLVDFRLEDRTIGDVNMKPCALISICTMIT